MIRNILKYVLGLEKKGRKLLLLPILHELLLCSFLTYVLEWSIWGGLNGKTLEGVRVGEIPF